MTTTAATYAVLGVGRMGTQIAHRLARVGLLAAVCDRQPGRAEAIRRRYPTVAVAWTARELAERPKVRTVLCSLPDPMGVRLAYEGSSGLLAGLRDGVSTVVEMSTIAPGQVKGLADHVAARGGRLLAAPLSGAPTAVAAGEALIITAGSEDALTQARPALAAIGRLAPHLGADPAAAALVKLVGVNAPLYALSAALVEALAVLERAGINRALAVEILCASALASPALSSRRAALAGDDAPTLFPLQDGVAKDLDLALTEARRRGMAMPQTQQAAEAVETAVEAGHGHKDLVVGLVASLRGGPVATKEPSTSIG